MTPLSLALAALAYGAFYAAAPGRQSQPVGPPRLLWWAGVALTVAALAVSIIGTGSAVGPVLVVTVMMAVASLLAMVGPFVLPEAKPTETRRAPAPSGSGARPAGVPTSAKPVGAKLPMRPPTRPPST